MIPHLKSARLVAVFGDDAYRVVEFLRCDATRGGIRAVTVGDTCWIEGRRFAQMLRRIAVDMAGLVILNLQSAHPIHVKSVLSVADLGVATVAGGERTYLIPRDGSGFPVLLPSPPSSAPRKVPVFKSYMTGEECHG